MVAVNQNSILGSIVPDVYIKKITLENEGSVPEEVNPHIDHEREPNITRDPETGELVLEIVNPQDFSFKTSQESKPLRITVDLAIKEKLDDGLVASWFGNQDFLKYIRLRVLQSRDETFTYDLITRDEGVTIFDFIREWQTSQRSVRTNGYKIKDIPVKPLLTKSSLDQHETMVDRDGNTIHTISFQLKFEIPDSNPKHLIYFAMSYIDLEKLAEDFELDLPPGMERTLDGRIATEVVIEDYDLVSETHTFLDEQGKIWAGPVFKDEQGRWKTGTENTPQSRFLQLITVPTSKIQDFRDVVDIERLQLDFSIVENEILSRFNSLRKVTNDRTDPVKKATYFTEAFLTKDLRGYVRFLFGVDYLKAVRENTVFGKIFRYDNEELLDNVKIRSLTIKRVRASNSEDALKDENGITWFDYNEEPEEVIFHSTEIEPGEFNQRENERGSLREILLPLRGDNPGLRFFTGIDKTITNVSYGKYQYGIELEVEDRTSLYMASLVDSLLNSYQILKQYYNEGVLIDNFDIESNTFSQKFQLEKEREFDEQIEDIKESDPSLSEEQVEELAIERMPWNIAASSYLTTMSILHKDFEQKKYADLMLSFIHPLTGNPNGVQVVLGLMETLANKISDAIGTQVTGKVSKWEPGQEQARPFSVKQRNGSVMLKTFKLSKYSSELFDADAPRNIGYDFLSAEGNSQLEDSEDGLKTIAVSQYEARVNKETLKYFKNLEADINLKTDSITYTTDDRIENTKYAFLTPSSVLFEGESSFLDQGEGLFDASKYIEKAVKIAKYNVSKGQTPVRITEKKTEVKQNSPLSEKQQRLKKILESMTSQGGLSVISLREYSRELLNTKDPANRKQTTRGKTKLVGIGGYFSIRDRALKEDISTRERASDGSSNDSDSFSDVNPNTALISVLENIFEEGESTAKMVDTKQQEQKKVKQNTIQAYNLKEPQNFLDVAAEKKITRLQFNEEVFKRGLKYQTYPSFSLFKQATTQTTTITDMRQQMIKDLPNQIKSLFVASVKEEAVVKNWFANNITTDPLGDPSQKLNFKLNYGIIRKIEVLTGFEVGTNSDGKTQIKEPIWEMMTPELFEYAKDKNVLCRMKRYENKKYGISWFKSLELPVFNEYFILRQDEERQTTAAPPAPRQTYIIPTGISTWSRSPNTRPLTARPSPPASYFNYDYLRRFRGGY
jgi:hypothetical protein